MCVVFLVLGSVNLLAQAPSGSPAAKKQAAKATAPNQSRRVFLPPDPRDEAAILAEDAKIPREQIPTGPQAEISLFGSQIATGRSFVFVIDRSNSMGSDGLGAIQAAAEELTTQLGKLTAEQTFQVVAYNEATAYFSGRQLAPASDENKRRLVKYVADLTAAGQTEHTRGLLAALRLKPEVIFLMTDGGDPAMKPADLQLIRQQAGKRTSIFCVQFGRGRKPDGPNFLSRLAAENRGSYVYLDVNGR